MFDNLSSFLNGVKFNEDKFFDGYVPLKDKKYCVVVTYDNDVTREYYDIDNPWKFMNGIKKNPRVKNFYIKE